MSYSFEKAIEAADVSIAALAVSLIVSVVLWAFLPFHIILMTNVGLWLIACAFMPDWKSEDINQQEGTSHERH